MLILYKNDASPPARAVMILADILGIQYEGRTLNPLLREQDTPDMTKKNPMRTIPILDDDGFCLADSHAIMMYLFDKYADEQHAHLYPRDARVRATIHQRLFFDCGVLFQRLRSIMAPTYGGRLTQLSKSMVKNTADAYGTLEAYLSEREYLADDVVTLADISAITTMSTLHGLYPINEQRYPKLKRWYDNMSRQEYCRRVNARGAAEHVAGLRALMDFNKQNIKSKI